MEPTRIRLNKRNTQILWVKGHQTINEQSPPEVLMNGRADYLANEAHTHPQSRGYTPPGYKFNLYIGDNKITTKYIREVGHAATTPAIRDYYRKRHSWTDATMHAIDCDAHGKAIKSFNWNNQKTIDQYVHDWLATGEKIKLRHNIEQV